ncbi:formyl-CoA transferase [Brevibacterium yomogidense]
MAYLGADVIKVEAPNHPDSWRGPRVGGAPIYYPDLKPGIDAQNQSVLFNSQNIDKRSIALNLKANGADAVMRDLAEDADVVLANFAPGVMDRLGVGHHALSQINPRIILVEMPAFGPGGPASSHQGMGKTMEPASGMTALMGYSDGTPVLTGPALMDPAGGLHAVAAVVTALELRERTGTGTRVLVPQVEAAASWIGEYILEQTETGNTWAPDGNHICDAAPHAAYPCRGDEDWITISVRDETAWASLCEVLSLADIVDDPRFATVEARQTAQVELDALIGQRTRNHDKCDLTARLQARGVTAAPVLNGAEIAQSTAMQQANMIVSLDHPVVGRREYSSLAFRHSRTPGSHRNAAPTFGEHNDEILRDLLKYDDARISHLRETGVIADDPTADTDTPRRNL